MTEDLRSSGADEGLVEDAEVVLAELVANAVEHGTPNEQNEFEVSWCLHDDHLLISVHDSGQIAADLLRAGEFTDDSLRGRGLAIVDYVCNNWKVDTDTGVRVTAELRFVPTSAMAGSLEPPSSSRTGQ